MKNAPYKSVLRALEVLELVGASHDGLRLNELADRLGFVQSQGALHALLHSLVCKGYLIRVPGPIRYVIGPSLDMVNRKNTFNSLYQNLSSVMSSICWQIDMRITYQQFVADRGVVLFCVNPETYLYVSINDYFNSPYGTSVIFQAYMTPQEQDRFWTANPMNDVEKKIWGNFENLRKYLKVAAKQRLAVIAPQHGQPFRVAGPIFDSSGKVTAAISAIQVESKLTPQQANNAAKLIHRAALELSANEPSQMSSNRAATYSAQGESCCLPTDHTRR